MLVDQKLGFGIEYKHENEAIVATALGGVGFSMALYTDRNSLLPRDRGGGCGVDAGTAG